MQGENRLESGRQTGAPLRFERSGGEAARRRLRGRAVAPLVATCGFAIGAASWAVRADAGVDFTPEISVGIAHTDNVNLAAENPEAETIYELIPAFNLSQTSTRLSTKAAYRLEGYYYKHLRDSNSYQRFDGEFSAALDPDNFYLDLGASRGQSIRDPQAPIPRSNLPIDNNLVNRDDYYAGFHFQYPFGANATARATDRHGWTRFGDISPSPGPLLLNDLKDETIDFSLDNYRKDKGFTWATRYNAQKTDYDIGKPWEHRQATVELGAWLAHAFRIFASGGKESAWDQPFDPTLADGFWEVGFAKEAGDRFHAELAAGERSFGSSRRASLTANLRRMHTSISYTEEPTTTNRDRYNGLLQPEQPQDFLAQLGAAERYISKRFLWTGGIDLRITSITLSVFDESRNGRTALDGTPLGDEKQRGATVSATWRAGARTEFELSVDRAHREFTGVEDRDFRAEALSVDYRIGARTHTTLQYGRTTDASSTGGGSYSADVVSLLLTREF